jgi:hypothetical protein
VLRAKSVSDFRVFQILDYLHVHNLNKCVYETQFHGMEFSTWHSKKFWTLDHFEV